MHVNRSLAVGDSEFWTAAQIDRAGYRPAFGIDYRGAVGVSVHGKDTFRCGIVNNAVRVFIGFGLADRLKGLQVENDDFALAPVRDESAAKLRRHRDSVVLFQAGDVADQAAPTATDYFNLL